MPNYNRYGPFTDGAAPGLDAQFFNNIENVFVQPSGGSESGGYFIAFTPQTTGALVSCYYPSLSRTATPVSITGIDASDGMSGSGVPISAHLTSKGVLMYTDSTGTGNVNSGGNLTLNY